MTSKQKSARQHQAHTFLERHVRRKAALAASASASPTVDENTRVWANAQMDDDGAALECTDEKQNSGISPGGITIFSPPRRLEIKGESKPFDSGATPALDNLIASVRGRMTIGPSTTAL